MVGLLLGRNEFWCGLVLPVLWGMGVVVGVEEEAWGLLLLM